MQQVEHGEGQSASASGSGSPVASASVGTTITKVFIGDRYYEASTNDGDTPVFYVAPIPPSCSADQNVAQAVLRVLRAIATSGTVDTGVAGFTYRPSAAGQAGELATGTATIDYGFIQTLTFDLASRTYLVTIGSINSAPSVTAPDAALPMTLSCPSAPLTPTSKTPSTPAVTPHSSTTVTTPPNVASGPLDGDLSGTVRNRAGDPIAGAYRDRARLVDRRAHGLQRPIRHAVPAHGERRHR